MNRPFDSSQIDTSRTAIHAELDSILASTKPGGDATPASQLHPSFEQGISAFPDAPSTPASPFTAMVDRTSVITPEFTPTPVSPSDDVVTEFFQGFSDGFTDAVSMGFVKTDLKGEGYAGKAGEIAGFIAGEVPYWLVGAGIAKHALRATRLGHKAAVTALRYSGSSRLGKRVLSKTISSGAVGESAIGFGVEAGRAIAGDEDAFSPDRVAIATLTPFVPALFARAKTPSTAKGIAKTSAEIREERIAGARDVFSLEDPTKVEIRIARLVGLREVFKRLPKGVEEFQVARESLYKEELFPQDIESALKLYQEGAPLDDIYALMGRESDEIDDFLMRADKSAWDSARIERTGTADDFKRVLTEIEEPINVPIEPMVNMDISKIPVPKPKQVTYLKLAQLQAEKSGVDFDFSGAVEGSTELAAKRAEVDDIKDVLQYVRKSIAGAAGGRPLEFGEGSIKDMHRLMDQYRSVTMGGVPMPPRGIRNRLWDAVLNNAPFTRMYLSSTLRGLESLGEGGVELAKLLDKTRLWHVRNSSRAAKDINNSLAELDADQTYEFVRAARGDLGPDAASTITDPTVKNALHVWNVHRKVIGDYHQANGALFRTMDADENIIEIPMSGIQSRSFFPEHVDDYQALFKDQKFMEHFAEEMTARFDINPNMAGLVNAQAMQEMLQRHVRLRQKGFLDGAVVPGFDLGENFKGSPKRYEEIRGAAAKGSKVSRKTQKALDSWQEEVKETLTMFVDNNYEIISKHRHLGTPNDFTDFTDLMTQDAVYSAPLQHALKNKFKDDEIVAKISEMAIAGKKDSQKIVREAAENLEHLGPDPRTRQKSFSMINYGGRARALVQHIKEEGGDADFAADAVEAFLGYKTYRKRAENFSRTVRDFQTVTKLGLAVIENVSQTAFTATKFGFTATYKALRDEVFHNNMNREFAEASGALLSDVLRTIEVESGKTWSGEFLKRTGFAAVERMNRSIGANAGKHFVLDSMARISRNPNSTISKNNIRQLSKMGWQMDKLVRKEGKKWEITDYGLNLFNNLKSDSDQVVSTVVKDLAGYEGAAQTQFLADLLDTPLGLTTPYGKIWGQFKSFAFNGAKAFHRDILDELRHGNPAPAIRMLVLGAAMGEATQNARMFVSGRDPKTRGQTGIIRELVGKTQLLDKDDEELTTILGQSISKSDLASRIIENVAGVGYAGAFVSIARSAAASGKLGLFGFLAGPTIDEGVSVAANVWQGAVTDNFEPLARRAIRTGGALAGSIPGVRAVPKGAFLATAAGRQAQLAIAPSEAQMESSLFVTEEEAANVAIKSVVRNYNLARKEARELAGGGDQQAAITRMTEWNDGLAPRVRMLRSFGAFNMQSWQRISFNAEDMRRVLYGGLEDAAEPGVVETSIDRSVGAFDRYREAGQALTRPFQGLAP